MRKKLDFIFCMLLILILALAVNCTTSSSHGPAQNGQVSKTDANNNGNGNGDADADVNDPGNQSEINALNKAKLNEGQRIFRADTFGSEAFWGDTLRLHEAIAGEKNGGVGPGLPPKTALALGLKVDMDAIPADLVANIRAGRVNLDDPATTLALLKIDAVVGVKGIFDSTGKVQSLGITCAFCHGTVDNAFAPGIGHRLDGWPNRDLDVGQIILFAPRADLVAQSLGITPDQLKEVLTAWGPGRYDAIVNMDGKGFTPDGKTAATLIPAAYGLLGMNLHTYTGWGSVPYWNAYVAITQMHGQGTFFDPRLNDPNKFPLAVKNQEWNKRPPRDLVTSKLAALHYYQISIPAPKPVAGSFNRTAAGRGQSLFNGKGDCARCHVPPLFMEPGWSMHDGSEIGIDDFTSSRSPDGKYRTAPLAGVSFRGQGGYYHDGRFADLKAVVTHYNDILRLNLTDAEMSDLVEYLKSL